MLVEQIFGVDQIFGADIYIIYMMLLAYSSYINKFSVCLDIM